MTTAAPEADPPNSNQLAAATSGVTLGDVAGVIKEALRGNPTRRPSHPDPLTKVQSSVVGTGRYIPTASLNPQNIELIEGVNDQNIGYIRPAIDAFSACHTGLKALSDAREQVRKDTSRTEANQILLIAAEGEKLLNRVDRAFKDAQKRLSDGITALDSSLSAPMTTAADNAISGELRALCRSLSTSDREKFIADAMKDRDTKVLNAILGAPAALSGLTKQMVAHHTRAYHEMMQPEIAARVTVMRKALALVESRSGLVVTEIEKALGSTWETVGKLRKTQSASEQALLLINNPVSQ